MRRTERRAEHGNLIMLDSTPDAEQIETLHSEISSLKQIIGLSRRLMAETCDVLSFLQGSTS